MKILFFLLEKIYMNEDTIPAKQPEEDIQQVKKRRVPVRLPGVKIALGDAINAIRPRVEIRKKKAMGSICIQATFAKRAKRVP